MSEKELEIGCDLIGQLTAPFQPEKFENEHQKRLQKLIEKKARGEKVVLLCPKLLQPTAPDQLVKAIAPGRILFRTLVREGGMKS